MSSYKTRNVKVSVGGRSYLLRILSDKQQFSDPDGHGNRLGISSAQWSLFGQLWPSSHVLAQAMYRFDIEGKRVLELGCGIALASLVLTQRGADVVASDFHPLAESFLAYNAALNALPAVNYRQLRWGHDAPTLGTFDLIIASDVLYERSQVDLMADVIKRHAKSKAEVVITDPGRGNSAHFGRLLGQLGFEFTSTRCRMDDSDAEPFRGQLLHYSRGMIAVTT